MKSITRILAILCLFVVSNMASAGWHEQTQDARNAQIVNQAYANAGMYGGQCKVWANNVVRIVSGAVGGSGTPINLPSNSNEGGTGMGYSWLLFTPESNNVISYGAQAPSAMKPGTIVQMRVKMKDGTYGPHTMIVTQNYPLYGYMWASESNYSVAGVVTARLVYYKWFGLQADGSQPPIENGNHYTAYLIR